MVYWFRFRLRVAAHACISYSKSCMIVATTVERTHTYLSFELQTSPKGRKDTLEDMKYEKKKPIDHRKYEISDQECKSPKCKLPM